MLYVLAMARVLMWSLLAAVGVASVEGCVGEIGADGDAPPAVAVPTETGVPVVGMRRLTTHEYDLTIYALVGDDAANSAATLPQDLPRPFDNDYPTQLQSRTLVDGVETLARDITTRLLADVARRDAVVGCAPSGVVDDTCTSAFVSRFGRRALRRPLTTVEVDEYASLAADYATQADDFYTGVEVVVRSMLQDIEFLYRVEIGAPVKEHPGVLRLSPFEVATRMSYLIWGTTPDDALLDLAAGGGLGDQQGVVDAAAGMLSDERARPQIDRFHAMWLGYDRLQHAPDINAAMRAETRALIERVVFDEQAPWLELFTAPETFVNDTLAQHYGLPVPGSSQPVWMDYSAEGRGGILSHGSFLSTAHDVGDTSPIRRGLHVLRHLACQEIAPPPPGAEDATQVDPSDCRMNGLIADMQDSTCGSCHAVINPIGFGLEAYDNAGRFRTHEQGKPQCPVDGEGELAGIGTFNGPAELGARLVESGMLEGCAVKHLFQYALGREPGADDDALLSQLTETFVDSGRHFDALVIGMVSDNAFFFRRNEEK